MRTMKNSHSNLQAARECLICGDTGYLHRHHVFYGSPNRKHSEEDGLWVWLCPYHHNASTDSVHANHQMDLKLKKFGQTVFEQTHTREEFIERYGKSYL